MHAAGGRAVRVGFLWPRPAHCVAGGAGEGAAPGSLLINRPYIARQVPSQGRT
jgi:hypothetical protein